MNANELKLLEALIELETVAKSGPEREGRSNLAMAIKQVNIACQSLTDDASPELMHFVKKRSFEKARDWLNEQRLAVGQAPSA